MKMMKIENCRQNDCQIWQFDIEKQGYFPSEKEGADFGNKKNIIIFFLEKYLLTIP